MRVIYTCLFYLLIPLILLRLLWRARLAPAYAERWAERFGFFSPLVTDKKIIWLHTVSVGEFLAALPLIRRLQANPNLHLVITTTTPTGSERVRASLGDSVSHVYAPYDLPNVLRRFIRRIRPSLLIIMETELWPNTLAVVARYQIPRMLINGRLSEKSARGYGRFSWLTKPMLQRLSCASIQHWDDAQRFIALGLPESAVHIVGNIKFDLTISSDLRIQAAHLKEQLSQAGTRIVLIAASTHDGEDEIILDAFQKLQESNHAETRTLLLVLVPRHPERFNSVGELCLQRGLRVGRRSQNDIQGETDVLLVDTMGELLLLFGASDIAFMGGSLVSKGGHNFIEPAAWQLPLLSGPSVFNFAEVARLLIAAEALELVSSAAELSDQIELLISKPDLRNQRGKAALEVANSNRGALDKTLALIENFIH